MVGMYLFKSHKVVVVVRMCPSKSVLCSRVCLMVSRLMQSLGTRLGPWMWLCTRVYSVVSRLKPTTQAQLHHQAVHCPHLLQVCSVHLHLLQHEVGAVFEERWRNSIDMTTDRIIIKSSPGAAVCPEQLPRVAAAPVLSLYVQCNLNKSLRSKPFNV